jgi:hypothetical protein
VKQARERKDPSVAGLQRVRGLLKPNDTQYAWRMVSTRTGVEGP